MRGSNNNYIAMVTFLDLSDISEYKAKFKCPELNLRYFLLRSGRAADISAEKMSLITEEKVLQKYCAGK